jgi:hypothetical protein
MDSSDHDGGIRERLEFRRRLARRLLFQDRLGRGNR